MELNCLVVYFAKSGTIKRTVDHGREAASRSSRRGAQPGEWAAELTAITSGELDVSSSGPGAASARPFSFERQG